MIFQLLTIIAFYKWTTKSEATLQKLTPDDGVDGDYFGFSVALYNTYAVIGAWQQDNYGKSQNGAAYVFERDTTTNLWSQTQRLNVSDDPSTTGRAFGYAVGIYGTRIVVGARQSDAMWGSAYVFELDSSSNRWSQTAALRRDQGGAAYFGHDVSIYDDYIAIGTRNEEAYIFTRDSVTSTWSQTARLLASDNVDNDYFASSLAIYGPYIVLGAASKDYNATVTNVGSAYIFQLNSATNTWEEVAKFTPDSGASTSFGSSVAIHGTTVLIGADGDDSQANNAGSAYIFELNTATNAWAQSVKLVPNDPTAGARFGMSVALYDIYALIGTKGSYAVASTAYVFELDTTTNVWTQTAKLVPSTASYDLLGSHRTVSVHDKYAMFGRSKEVTGSVYATTLIDYADTLTSEPSISPTESAVSASDAPSASPSAGPTESDSTATTGAPSLSPTPSGIVPASDSPSASPSDSPSAGPTETDDAATTRAPTPSPADGSTTGTTVFVESFDDSSQPQMKTLLSSVTSCLFLAAAILKSY